MRWPWRKKNPAALPAKKPLELMLIEAEKEAGDLRAKVSALEEIIKLRDERIAALNENEAYILRLEKKAKKAEEELEGVQDYWRNLWRSRRGGW